MPWPLPTARCALTAPFHPYLQSENQIGGLLSVALSLNFRANPSARRALPATLASWSPDFPRRSYPRRGCPAPWRASGSIIRVIFQAIVVHPQSNASAPISPSMVRGRKRRWKARMAAISGSSDDICASGERLIAEFVTGIDRFKAASAMPSSRQALANLDLRR